MEYAYVEKGGHFVRINAESLQSYLSAGYREANQAEFEKGRGIPQGSGSEPGAGSKPDTSWVNALYRKYFSRDATAAETENWKTLTPTQLESFLQAEQKKYGVVPEDAGRLPDEVRNADWYRALTEEQKGIVATVYSGIVAGSEAAAADADAALEKAIELADPYYRGQVMLAQDVLRQSLGRAEGDYQGKMKTLGDRIARIDEDLKYNREQLSLEEQAQLSALRRSYQIQLEDTQTQMQEAGLTFSSPREVAERRLATEFSETAQSRRRMFGEQLRNLQVSAARMTDDARQEQSEAGRARRESRESAISAAEGKLGSANLPAGVAGVGGVTGELEASRQASILDLEETLKKRGSQPLPL